MSWFAAAMLLAGSRPLQAVPISFPDFSSTTDLNIVGDAAQVGNIVRLSSSSPGERGSTWFRAKQGVEVGFDTTFSFRITAPAGADDADGLNGGDGFAFVVQNTSDAALGLANSYMGYEIANSLAVEFDTFRNGNFLALEPNSNHVGVQSLGTGVNTPFAPAFLASAAVGSNLSDGGVHTAKVSYAPGSLQIFVDDFIHPVLTVPVDLGSLLNLSAGTAYVGFTGGGAAAYENHDLLSWHFATVPEPSSISLAVGGVLGLLALTRRRQARI